MSNMEAFRQAAPPPRKGRPIVLSSDSEGDDFQPNRSKVQNSNGPMRPTDIQQVEARRSPLDQHQRPRTDKDQHHLPRPSKADPDIEEVLRHVGLGEIKSLSLSDDTRPASQSKPLGLTRPRPAEQTHAKSGAIQPETKNMRTVQHGDSNVHSGGKSASQGGIRPVSGSHKPPQDNRTHHRDQERRPVILQEVSRDEPRPRSQQFVSAASIPSRIDPSRQADYSKFKSGGAFTSPVRRQNDRIEVHPSSKFARPETQVPANSWMMDQLNTHHAMQRLNGRPTAGPPTSIPAYGVATGSNSYAGADPVKTQRKEDDGEEFSNALNDVRNDPNDHLRVSADQAEADMRELLSGAIGDGEDDQGEQGSNLVEGFAEGMSLMPHQVRGVAWMGKRETGIKRGGILADDMGLGKTVQTIAMILKRPRNKTEEKLGFEKTTLIVTPVAVMDQWIKEMKNKTTFGRLKVCCYHGPQRSKYADKLHKYDVVVTTYSTLSSEHGAPAREGTSKIKASVDSESESNSDGERFGKSIKKAKAKKSPLYELKWLRIVCDEAQNIKNRTTKAAKAAVALDARLRWCLTGTPIQNNVEELFSLFQFLRAKPLDDWTNFKVQIVQPVKQGKVKFAMKKIHAVLKAIMLRRTKDATIDGKAILNLPARNVNVISCEFDKAERDFYDALEKKQALTFNRFLKAGTAMANYTSVLTLLLRMRQACCHPSLVTASLSVDAAAIDSKPSNEEAETDELADLLQGVGLSKTRKCEVCLAPLEDPVATSCEECQQFVRKVREGSDVTSSMPPSSAKTRMTLELLRQIDDRSNCRQKTIIFSQFTSFLNIVEPFLKQAGVRYVRYDGSMRADKREQALEAIRNDPEIRLNSLIKWSHRNPALEDQAYDRAHRLGQKLDVHIYKLTVRESVEDRILKLQEAKRELAKAALSGDSTKNMKLQLQDLMDLFKPGRAGSRDDDD